MAQVRGDSEEHKVLNTVLNQLGAENFLKLALEDPKGLSEKLEGLYEASRRPPKPAPKILVTWSSTVTSTSVKFGRLGIETDGGGLRVLDSNTGEICVEWERAAGRPSTDPSQQSAQVRGSKPLDKTPTNHACMARAGRRGVWEK